MRGSRARTLILRYHRVADLQRDPNGIAVSVRHFEEHLEVLCRRFQPVPLEAVVAGIAAGRVPDRGVALTFDDGYADVIHPVRPLLERYDVPATVYIVTGTLAGDREHWWDVLERVFATDPLPSRLEITIGRSRLGFDLGPGPTGNGAGPPVKAFRTLFERLRRLAAPAREDAMARLVDWARLSPGVRSSHRLLGPADIVALDRSSPVAIGAHSVTHPMLTHLRPPRRREEIGASKQTLEALVGHSITSFAYPFGTGTTSAGMVRQAGFRSACTTRDGAVNGRADPWRLPRIYVGDWDGEELERRLAHLS